MNDALDQSIRAVAGFVVADAPLGVTLQRIADLAVDAIESADAVGLTLLDEHGRPTTAVATADLAPEVDGGQYQNGIGPCLDAFSEGRIVRVDDTRAVARIWPAFSRAAVAHGVLSTLSLPLGAAGETLGAMNLYARTTGAFAPSDEEAASLFAVQAAVVLLNARAYWDAFKLADSLQRAMEHRAVIEQAKGKIMAQSNCTAAEAFDILRRASQRSNMKLRELARQIVEDTGPAP